MTRRLEAGPVLVTLGALLLLVSLFLDWYTPGLTAWQAFEVWDLVLFLLALGSIAAGLGLIVPDVDVVDRRWLPAAVIAVVVIVAAQIIDPPPAATGQERETGAWLALGAALLMCAGGILTFGRVQLAFTMDGRDPRRRVSAVDARGPEDPTTENNPAVVPTAAADEGEGEAAPGRADDGSGAGARGGRLFSRDRAPAENAAAVAPTAATEPLPGAAGDPPPGPKQD